MRSLKEEKEEVRRTSRVKGFNLVDAITYSYYHDLRFVSAFCLILGFFRLMGISARTSAQKTRRAGLSRPRAAFSKVGTLALSWSEVRSS